MVRLGTTPGTHRCRQENPEMNEKTDRVFSMAQLSSWYCSESAHVCQTIEQSFLRALFSKNLILV